MAKEQLAPDASDRADRARRLREAFGYTTSTGFAQYLGVNYTRWNNCENGYPFSRQIEDILIRKCPGVTVEWLRYGISDRLPVELARRLGLL